MSPISTQRAIFMRSSIEYRLARLLVIFIFLLIIVNPLIVGVDTTFAASVLALIGLIISLIKGFKFRRSFPLVFFVISTIVLMLIGVIQTSDLNGSIHYAALLTLWPFFWMIMLGRYDQKLIIDLLPFIYHMAVLIALLSYVQFFLSPNLWGVLNFSSSALEWASTQEFEEYSTYFRATSLVGSPQVLGLFCPLIAAILIHDSRIGFVLKGIYLTILLGASLLTASKASLVLYMILVAILMIRHRGAGANSKLHIGAQLLIVALILILSILIFYISTYVPIIERVFDLQAAIDQESRDSRLHRLLVTVTNTNPFIGNGYSQRLFSDLTGYPAAESYIGKLYFHYGIVPVFALLSVVYWSYKNSAGFEQFTSKLIVLLVFVSLWMSTAFESPVFFPVWGVLICGLFSRSRTSLFNSN